ncbi:MAG TPA: tandem-95 repeat protein [Candidatus Marinimicrobia bacterium]|nr:tandem-95 repeat protein [Candidatus Neomarinimicrobiota bacterium]
MKHVLISLVLFTTVIFPSRIISGQNSITAHTISDSAHEARSIFAADVDGDGDMDVLSGHYNIAWYENDGSESFTPHTISTSAASSVYAIDLDDDGDMDVVGSSAGSVGWYENDGSGSFATHKICNHYYHREFRSVYALDVDGDGDMDVVTASYSPNDKIMWYENDGSQYFNHHIIADSVIGARSVSAADIDGDGDMDVLSGHNNIVWYEYDGLESFNTHTVATSGVSSVYAVDVDGDGDIDVVGSSAGSVGWYENDGFESFTTRTVSTSGASSVYAVDLDGDGDMDVVGSSAGSVSWYENGGSENFTTHIITTAADDVQSVYTADVDGDGDLDVLSAALGDSKISWYEINYSPIANDTAITSSEDRDYTGMLSASDSDGDALTYSIIIGPANGRATVSDNATGTFSYRPVADYTGLDSLIFSVTDSVLSDIATVSITVTAVNDAPVAVTAAVTTEEDMDHSGLVSAFDIDNDPLTYSLLTEPSHGTVAIIDSSAGTYTYSPKVNYNGSDSFTFTSSDGTLSDTSKVSITVTAVNDSPVAFAERVTTSEDTKYSGSVSASDVENDILTYNILTNPSNGTVSITNSSLGTFTYSPTINYNGDDSFTFTANDYNYSDTATVSITITAWNNYAPDQLPAVHLGNLPAVLRQIITVVCPGIYLYKIQTGEYMRTRKMVLLK